MKKPILPYVVHILDRGTITIPSKMESEKKRIKGKKKRGKRKKN